MAVAVTVAFALALAAPVDAESACAAPVGKYNPPSGMIPNQSVALIVARTYLSTIYGDKMIKGEAPLTAMLRAGVWRVEGSLKRGWKGGVAEIEICQSNGRVLSVIHGK